MYYTLFHANVAYHKKVKDVQWNERNWRWETTGLGMMRNLEQTAASASTPDHQPIPKTAARSG